MSARRLEPEPPGDLRCSSSLCASAHAHAYREVTAGHLACRIYRFVTDERSGRVTEELVVELEDDLSPRAALSAFIADHDPPAGTYTASCRLGTATVTYDGGRR